MGLNQILIKNECKCVKSKEIIGHKVTPFTERHSLSVSSAERNRRLSSTMTILAKYLTIDDSIDDNEEHPPEDRRLSLAYEDLSEIPCNIAERFGWWVQILDLSNNEISDVKFLSCFDRLNTVILDRNKLQSVTVFPPLPSIRTLWVNHNQISNIFIFLPNLTRSCPNIENLSMMGNVGAPCFLNGGTVKQNYHYRIYVASLFPKLRHLDERKVSAREKDDAGRLKEAKDRAISRKINQKTEELYYSRSGNNNIV